MLRLEPLRDHRFSAGGQRNEYALQEAVDVGEGCDREENFAIGARGQMYSKQCSAVTRLPCLCSTALGSPVVPPLNNSAAESAGVAVRRPTGAPALAISSGIVMSCPRQTTPGMPRSRARPNTFSRVLGAQSTARGVAPRSSRDSSAAG